MEFSFTNTIDGSTVKALLKRHGVSKRFLSHIKFDGGEILVNGMERNVLFPLQIDDVVTIITPIEQGTDLLIPEDIDPEVVFEDDHYLIVNKPAGRTSITGRLHPTGAMSNIVKGYIVRKKYEDQTVHIITRLDRDTSGLMIFAKHSLAHSLIVHPKYKDSVTKRYYAIIHADEKMPKTGEINLPIGRVETSIIERRVHPEGKEAKTSYEVVAEKNGLMQLDVVLHTGRTHQIRVHFSHLGHILVGDELYGGNHELIDRQALHCHHLQFVHPFTDELIDIELEMPEDMQKLMRE